MKNATLLGLSLFTAVIGLSSFASAIPIENHGEYVSDAAKTKTDGTANHGSYVSDVAKSGITGTTSTTVQSVPEPSALLLLGAAFLVFAVWHQRFRKGMAA
jgi:hypothetical protein